LLTTKRLNPNKNKKKRPSSINGITVDDRQDTAIFSAGQPRISYSVRRIVVQQPEMSLGEICKAMIGLGLDEIEITRRLSIISTLRSGALAVLTLARQHGWATRRVAGNTE
jgi:hypothetical protein